jgi:hypothetical protein
MNFLQSSLHSFEFFEMTFSESDDQGP